MKWDIDSIIAVGLVITLVLFIVGEFALNMLDKPPLPTELGCTIAAGLLGYMKSRNVKEVHDDNPKQQSA